MSSFASVSGIVFLCDSFWGDFDLNALRNLISTSKGFHDELVTCTSVRDNTNNRSLTEHALLSMIKNRPFAFNGWVLNFLYAKHRFSLPMDMMLRHCSLLPVGDRCYYNRSSSSAGGVQNSINPNGAIHFIDAYRLAVNRPGGMKAAMERRHKLTIKVQNSARALVEKVGDRYQLIEANAHKAADVMRKKNRVDGDFTHRMRIGLLSQLGYEAEYASFRMALTVERLSVWGHVTPESSESVRDHARFFKKIVARYRVCSAYCPEVMALDFLE